MKTKEQKIKEIILSMNIYKSDCKAFPHTKYAIYARRRYKELKQELKQELKELEERK